MRAGVLARFHQKLVILSGPGTLQLRFLDRNFTASAISRAYSSPAVVLARGSRSLLPATRSRSYSHSLSLPTAFSKTRFQTFANHLEHVRFSGSLYLCRSFPRSLFKLAKDLDRVKLLVNHTLDLLFLFFFCQTHVLSIRAPTLFSPCS